MNQAGRRPGRRGFGSAVAAGVLLFARLAAAQSYFSVGGLGELAQPVEARTEGLGRPVALAALNPGILVHLPRTSFNVTMLAAATAGSQDSRDRLISSIRPGSINAAVPLPLQTRALVGLEERFNQDFDVWSESTPGIAYRRHVIGSGGIHALRAGLAKSLFDRFCLGIEYDRVVGGSRENWRFEIPEGGYTATDTIEMDYSANTLRLGGSLQVHLLTLAACYEPGATIAARRYKRVHGVIDDSLRTYKVKLPNSVYFGAGLEPREGWLVSAGFDYRPWSGASVDGSSAGYRDAWRGSAGVEFMAAPSVPFRAGYSYQQWYFQAAAAGGSRSLINEHCLHLGTSIPVPKFGSLDLAAAISARHSNSLSEYAGKLFLTVAYSELWTRRTRRWGY